MVGHRWSAATADHLHLIERGEDETYPRRSRRTDHARDAYRRERDQQALSAAVAASHRAPASGTGHYLANDIRIAFPLSEKRPRQTGRLRTQSDCEQKALGEKVFKLDEASKP